MARNGSGVYSLPAGSSVTNGDISDASDLNTPFSDLEADMNIARPVVAGGTGATTAAAARTNLGVSAATDVLAKANNLSDVANAATARTNLGLQIGVNVQAWDADLDTWAFKTPPTGAVIGATDTQTLSNKTISSPIIQAATFNGVVSGNSLSSTVDAEAGTSNERIMTPLRTVESILAQVPTTLSGTSGYVTLPGGMIMQAGFAADTGTSMTITYPIPFPNRVLSVQLQMVRNIANNQGTTINTNYNTSLTSVDFIWDSNADGVTWFAIGY